MKTMIILLFFMLSCSHSGQLNRTPAESLSSEIVPIKTPEELRVNYQKEIVQRLRDARVIYADYELIKRDFPALREISHSQIDQWLLDGTAYMSKPQVAQQLANNPILVTEKTKEAIRPPDYGRALVFPVHDSAGEMIGQIDAKGVGSLNPRPGGHSDGLMTLGESIREYLYEKLVNQLFAHDGSGNKTVGSYAVIDTGFQLKHADGSTSPSGIYLRQSHRRYNGKMSILSEFDSVRIEKILRRYGVTSAGAYRDRYRYDMINIQGTQDKAVLDFGGFLTLKDFGQRKGQHFYGTKTILQATDATLNEGLRVPYDLWGPSVSGIEDPKLDNVWLWSHELADALAKGHASRDDAYQHLQNMLSPVFENLDQNPLPSMNQLSCNQLLMRLLLK